ncbi:hypothetical protein ABPG72_008254 [Tetrahymena utriculariae]
MKRQQTNIYANVQEDSVRQQDGWNHESQQDEKEQQEEEFQSNLIKIQVNESQQQNTEKIYQKTLQPLKKTSQANKIEYKLNQNHVKEKFSGLLNAESLVDQDNSTLRLQQNFNSSINLGADSSKSQQAKKIIEEVLGGKSNNPKSSLKSLFQGQSKKLKKGSHSLFGTFQNKDQEVKEQSSKNQQKLQTQNRLQQLGLITQQRVYSETDILKNNKQDTRLNEMTTNTKQILSGVFFNSQVSSFQKPQSISSQSKRVSTSQSRSQIDFMRGSTSGGVRAINRGNILQQQSAFYTQTPGDVSKRVKTQGESTYDSESYGQSIFFQTSRQTVSQSSQNSQNNFKFQRVQNSSHTQKPQSELKSSNLSEFRNVSHIQPKQKDQTQIQIETPLISQFENETNEKIKKNKQLNNIYLKMLDEFQIPYEQDIDKIKAKINELKLQSLDGIHNIDKQFVVNLLQKQVESYKIENMKARQLRTPTNRYEVEVLQQWMDFMLFKIYQDKTDTGQEILEKAQLIFESCFQELFKQISTDCQERGILLQKVWTNQNEIFIKLLEEQQKQRLRHEQESLDEISRVHKMYTKEIQTLQSNLSDIISQKSKLTERFDLIKNNVKYLKKNNKYLTKMTKTMREDIEFYKKNNQDLEYAANQMKKEYLNLSNSQQQIITVTKPQNKSYNQIKNSSQSNLQKKSIQNLKDQSSSLLSVQKQKIVNQSLQTLSNIKQLQNEDSQSDNSLNGDFSQEDQHSVQNESMSRNSVAKSYQQQTQQYLSQQQLDNSKNNQVSLEENLKTINSILESQSQLAVIQAKFTKSYIQMQEMSDDDDDEDIYLVDKQIDAQDWQNDFHREIEVMTEGAMKDIFFKSDIVIEEKSTQIDFNIFKEFGNFLADKEVQTTDLNPEYEEKMKGQDVQGLEKFLDNISKAQDLYEKAMNNVNIPFEVKKAMHNYLKFLHKNQEQMQFLLKTEIGLKDKYHKENIQLKIFNQENQNTLEELNQKIEQLEEANRIITQENQELDRNVIQLVRRTKRLTTNMEHFKQISSQLYTETSKLADNLSKTNAFDMIIKKVSKGVDIDEQDIDILRNRISGNGQTQIKSSNGLFSNLIKSQKIISENPLDEHDEESKQENEVGLSQQFKRDQNKKNTIVLSKIKSAVKQLFDLNEQSFKDGDSSSSDEDVEQLMTQSKVMKNQSKIRFSENLSPSLTNLNPGVSIQQKSSVILEKSKQFTYKFNNPKFERKKVVKVNSANLNSSLALYNKIMRRIQKSQAKMTMTKKNVCKYITNIYNEKQKNELTRNDPLHVVCYDYFVSSFGLKKVAETKILQFYEAIYFFKNNSTRIKLFGSFLGLYEEYSNDELDFYLSTLKQLDEEVPNFVQTQHQLTEIVYCSFEKIISILKRQEEETNKIFIDKQISHIQKNRILSKQNNNYPMVDVDIAMERVLEGYQRIKQSNKELIVLFTSADLDLDGVIGFYEFMCLYKYIEEKEDDNSDLLNAKKLFFSKCDALNSETGEKALSLEAFVSMCTINGFFRQDKVQKFANSNLSPRDCQNFEQLKSNQGDLIQQIKMRLIKANAYSPFFSKAIQNLVKIIEKQQIDNEQKQTTWISYRILDLESKKAILLFQMHNYLPSEFIDIIMKYKDIDESDEQEQYWPSERNINYFIA